MIANINVRFFAEALIKVEDFAGISESFEITEGCFFWLHNKPCVVYYDRNTALDNGAKQICLTVICDDLPYADELEIIE